MKKNDKLKFYSEKESKEEFNKLINESIKKQRRNIEIAKEIFTKKNQEIVDEMTNNYKTEIEKLNKLKNDI